MFATAILAFAVTLLFFGIVVPQGRFRFLLGSAALFQLALFLGVAGIIVRAIWFLPGQDKKQLW